MNSFIMIKNVKRNHQITTLGKNKILKNKENKGESFYFY